MNTTITTPPPTETPDIESSTDDYATRFSGPVGQYLLLRQEELIIAALKKFPVTSVLDVGGGHAQLVEPLLREGYQLTVQGSDYSCQARLADKIANKQCDFVQSALYQLPFADQSIDAVISIRILSHLRDWPGFIAELCRVAKYCVIIDYPTWLSFNILSPVLFELKKKIEKNTRHYQVFHNSAVLEAFAKQGYTQHQVSPQFFFPMALHRAIKSSAVSNSIEKVADNLGLTRGFGSPVIGGFWRG